MYQTGQRNQHKTRRIAVRRLRQFARDDDGAILIEFAIVLPILLLLVFGAVTWAYTLSVNDAMFDAARQAAREISVGTSNETQARSSAEAVLSIWPTAFVVTAEDTSTTGTEDVRVVVTTTNVMASMFSFIPLPETIHAEVVMRKESP